MIHDRSVSPGSGRAFLRGGTIFHGGKQMPCVVKGLSDSAARLLVYLPDQLPPTFRLHIQLNAMDVDCTVVWRRGKEIGVTFAQQDQVIHADFGGRQGAIADGLRPLPDRPAAAALSPPTGEARQPIPLLIAEDDPDDRLMIEDAFRDCGMPCALHFVADGEDLLAYLHALAPHGANPTPALILLDLNMPRMDGRTALQRIKQHPELKRIPVVAFTTSNSDDDVQSTYDLGVSSYISKPSDYEGLLDTVRMLNMYWGNRVRLPR